MNANVQVESVAKAARHPRAIVGAGLRSAILRGATGLLGACIVTACNPGSVSLKPDAEPGQPGARWIETGTGERIWEKSFSREGREILSLILNGRVEAAERLLSSFDDRSRGGSETKILEACRAVADPSSYLPGQHEAIAGFVPLPFFQAPSPTQKIRKNLELAMDLDARWRAVAADLLIEVVTRRLDEMARSGQSLLGLTDDVLASPDPRYQQAHRGADELGGGLAIVLGRWDPTELLTSSETLQGTLAVLMAASQDSKQRRHPFTPGRWAEVFGMARSLGNANAGAWAPKFGMIAKQFHQAGLHASALLVHRTWAGSAGDPPFTVFNSGLETLTPWVESLVDDPRRGRRLAVALGYWGEVHRPGLPAEALSAKSPMAVLLARLAAHGRFSDALTVAIHLAMDDSVVTTPVCRYPWRELASRQEAFDLARAQQAPTDYERQMRQVAEQGHGDALFCMGDFHERGVGGQTDLDRARRYYEQAVQAGSPEACNQLGIWRENGIGGSKDLHAALDHYRRAADLGLPAGLCNLARLHLEGVEGHSNPPLAIALYRHAARHGSAVALNELGGCYAQGLGLPKSAEEAFALFAAAAQQSFPPARYNLGLYYAEGIGTGKDEGRAFHEMQASAEGGYAPAAYNLACFFQQGIGTSRDVAKAQEWMEQAARLGSPEAKSVLAEQKQQQALAERTARTVATPQASPAHRPRPSTVRPPIDTPSQIGANASDQASLEYELRKVRTHYNRLRAQPGADLGRIDTAERVAIEATRQKLQRQYGIGGR